MKNKKRIFAAVVGVCILISAVILAVANRLEISMAEKSVLYQQKQELTGEMEAMQKELSDIKLQKEETEKKLSIFDTRLAALREMQTSLASELENDRILYELTPPKMGFNYDVEMFKEAQKSSSRAGTVEKALFGGLFGTAMSAGQQDNMDKVYENRLAFYEKLTNGISKSLEEVNLAKAEFDSKFGFWDSLSREETEAGLFAGEEWLECAKTDAALDLERAALVKALSKYYYNLNLVYTMYDLTLSSQETSFLNELAGQLSGIRQVLDIYDPELTAGYSEEEKNSRYTGLLENYMQTVDFMVSAASSDIGIENLGEKTAYQVAFLRAYGNKGVITYIKECTSSSFDLAQVEKRYYDREGNPLYLKLNRGTVTLHDGKIIDFTCEGEVMAEKLVEEAKRIWQEYPQDSFGQNYRNYAIS